MAKRMQQIRRPKNIRRMVDDTEDPSVAIEHDGRRRAQGMIIREEHHEGFFSHLLEDTGREPCAR